MNILSKSFFLPIVVSIFVPAFSIASNVEFRDNTGDYHGSVIGKLNESQGQISYQIPIKVPEGINGLKADIGLSYSTSSKEHLTTGLGWILRGVPIISKCDIYDNGNILKKLCYGGSELVVKNGTYWGGGSEYKTKFNNGKTIKLYYSGNDYSFKVINDKTGITEYFGGVNYVKESDSGIEFQWLLSKKIDRSGNEVNYNYGISVNNIDHWINSIRYDDVRIAFDYSDKDPITSGYIQDDGYPPEIIKENIHRERKKLDRINLHAKGINYGTYNLNYTKHKDFYSISSIEYCSSTSICLTSLNFEYKFRDDYEYIINNKDSSDNYYGSLVKYFKVLNNEGYEISTEFSSLARMGNGYVTTGSSIDDTKLYNESDAFVARKTKFYHMYSRNNYESNYSYKNGRWNKKLNIALGFEEIKVKKGLDSILNRYEQEYPFHKRILKSNINGLDVTNFNYVDASSDRDYHTIRVEEKETKKSNDRTNTYTNESVKRQYNASGDLIKETTTYSSDYDNNTYENITEFGTYQSHMPSYKSTSFYKNGVRHREDKIVYINDYENRRVIEEKILSIGGMNHIVKYYYNIKGQVEKIEQHGLSPIFDNQGNIINTKPDMRSTEFSYDGPFVSKITKPHGHIEEFVYNRVCGEKTLYKNVNNQESLYGFDSFCRPVWSQSSDGVNTNIEYGYTSYEKPYHFSYIVKNKTDGQPETWKKYNARNLLISDYKESINGEYISEHYTYDINKNILSKSRPTTNSKGSTSFYYRYDTKGRRTSLQTPDGEFKFYFNENYVSKTTKNMSSEFSYFDAMGNIVKVYKNGGNVLIHDYGSDGTINSTNNNGIITSFKYENGKRIQIDDPSKGTWKYRFNSYGEEVWRKDANGQITETFYDQLGRITRKVSNDIYGRLTDVTNIWDTSENGLGKIHHLISNDKRTTYSYDTYGRLKSQSQNGYSGSTKYLEVNVDYDEYGRIKTETRPGDFKIHNEYNSSGILTGVYKNKSLNDQYKALLKNIDKVVKEHVLSINKEYDSIDLLINDLESGYNDVLGKLENFSKRDAYYNNYNRDVQFGSNTFPKISMSWYLNEMPLDIHKDSENNFYYSTNYGGDTYWFAQRYEEFCSPSYSGFETRENTPKYILDESPQNCHSHFSYLEALPQEEADWFGVGTKTTKFATMFRHIEKAENPLKFGASKELLFDVNIDDQLSILNRDTINRLSELAREYNNELKKLKQIRADLDSVSENYKKVIDRLGHLKKNPSHSVTSKLVNAWKMAKSDDFYADMLSSGKYYFWKLGDMDHEGRITNYTTGNGVTTVKTYDIDTGYLEAEQSVGLEVIRDIQYTYDLNSNISSRIDWVNNIEQYMSYDDMNRIEFIHTSLSDVEITNSFNYDKYGNLIEKDGKSRIYGSTERNIGNAGPFAVREYNGNSYHYDENGNMTSGGGRSITWNQIGKPQRIIKNGSWVEFEYNALGNRIQKSTNSGFVNYFNNVYEEHVTNYGDVTKKHFVYANGMLHAIEEITKSNISNIFYVYSDVLGSVDTVLDESAGVIERISYGAFGSRNNVTSLNTVRQYTPISTNRGFTGHEHIDEVDFIHMNGRIYDAELGRFLSADPFIQSPMNSQSYNRYSYVMNNPLKYVDPSGYFWDSWDDFVDDASDAWDFVSDAWDDAVDSISDAYESLANSATDMLGEVADFAGDAYDFTVNNILRPVFNLGVDIVGKVWALPGTVVGLALGTTGYALGLILQTDPQITFEYNAINFLNNPLMPKFTAITFGNTVNYGEGVTPSSDRSYNDPDVKYGPHEQAHTYQWQMLGIFFLPAYVRSGNIASTENPYEQAAQDYGHNDNFDFETNTSSESYMP